MRKIRQHQGRRSPDHPKLWKQFAVALGADKNEISESKIAQINDLEKKINILWFNLPQDI